MFFGKLFHTEMNQVNCSWLSVLCYTNYFSLVPDVILASAAKNIQIEPLEAKEVSF